MLNTTELRDFAAMVGWEHGESHRLEWWQEHESDMDTDDLTPDYAYLENGKITITAHGMLAAMAWAVKNKLYPSIDTRFMAVWIKDAEGTRFHVDFETIEDIPATVVRAIYAGMKHA